MKVLIQPVRHRRGRWLETTYDKAQAYELRHLNGARIRRVSSLAEARRLVAILSAPPHRSREAILGCRYSEVRNEVAARNPSTIAQSLTKEQYDALQ